MKEPLPQDVVKSTQGRFKWPALILCFLSIELSALWPFHVLSSYIPLVFQDRDMERALKLISGNWIFFGPEMTGGGNLPGPFYYFLMAPALWLNNSWEGVCILLYFLAGSAAAMCAFLLQRWLKFETSILCFSMLAVSPFLLDLYAMLLNSSFAGPAAIVLIPLAAIALTAAQSETRSRATIAFSFGLGLAIQLHLSLIFIGIAFASLLVGSRPSGIQKLSSKQIAQALISFLIPLMPYFFWALAEHWGYSFGQTRPYVGDAKNALPSLLSMMHMLFEIEPSEFAWTAICRLIRLFPLGLPILLISKKLTTFRSSPIQEGPRHVLNRIFIFSLIPAAYWLIATIGFRYSIITGVCAILIFIFEFESSSESSRVLKVFSIASLVILGIMWLSLSQSKYVQSQFPLIIISGLAATIPATMAAGATHSSNRFLKGFSVWCAITLFSTQVFASRTFFTSGPRLSPRVEVWRIIFSTILDQTGWSFEETSQRVFYVNHHVEQETRPGFEKAMQNTPSVRPREGETPDGFFVSIDWMPGSSNREQVRDWLLKQNLQSDLKAMIISGDLKVGRSRLEHFLVAPYRLTHRSPIKSFHNLGEAYRQSSEEIELHSLPFATGATKLPDGRIAFKWNDCGGLNLFCATGAFITTSRLSPQNLVISLRVVGLAISQSSPWISPDHTERWINPSLKIHCNDRQSSVPLISSLGFSRLHAADPIRNLLWGNNSILAPIDFRFEVQCEKLMSISLRREAIEVERIFNVDKFGGTEISFNVD